MALAFLAFLGAIAIIPFFIIYGTWAWGIVIQKTWAWFIVPSFSFQPLTFHQSIAISIFVALFFLKAHQHKTEKTPDGEVDWGAFAGHFIYALVIPWVALFFNWITFLIFM